MILSYEGLDAALERVERYGSSGERQIAWTLAGHGVRFLYEHPVAVVDRGKVRVWYPDFWLPNYCIAMEYVGIEDDDDYSRRALHRKAIFKEAGVPYLMVSKADLRGDWPKRILQDIRLTLCERIEKFEADTAYSMDGSVGE